MRSHNCSNGTPLEHLIFGCTDRKENQIFLTYKEIQMGEIIKYLRISSYIRKPFLIHDFATGPI
jgi:hypothetical protein